MRVVACIPLDVLTKAPGVFARFTDLTKSVVSAAFFKRLAAALIFLLLLAIGGVFRFVSLKKFSIVNDENITRAVADNIRRGDLRNDWRYVPQIPKPFQVHCYNFSSYFYADALALGLRPNQPLFRERFFSAICGTLAVAAFSLVALQLFGKKTALATAALLAVFPLLVQDSHYARPEAFATLLCALLYAASAALLAGWRPRLTLALGAFLCGLLIASKFSYIPLVIVPLVGAYSRGLPWRRSFPVWAGSVLLGAFAGVPNAFFHPTYFWEGVQMLRHQYANEHVPHSLPNSSYSWRLLIPYFWQTAGAAFCLLSLFGAIFLLWRRRLVESAIITAPLLFYLFAFGQQRVFFERNLSHVVPLAAILAAAGLVVLAEFLGRSTWRNLAFAAGLVFLLAQPFLVSHILVFQALRTSSKIRARSLEQQLIRQQHAPLLLDSELLTSGHIDNLASIAKYSAGPFLTATPDFNDPYTAANLKHLETRVRTKVVGRLPSLFSGFVTSTLLVYHSPALRYLLLTPPDSFEAPEANFVSWGHVSSLIRPKAIEAHAWVRNGMPSVVPVPAKNTEIYGSYTPELGDTNRGRLTIGPFHVPNNGAIGILCIQDSRRSASLYPSSTTIPAV